MKNIKATLQGIPPPANTDYSSVGLNKKWHKHHLSYLVHGWLRYSSKPSVSLHIFGLNHYLLFNEMREIQYTQETMKYRCLFKKKTQL